MLMRDQIMYSLLLGLVGLLVVVHAGFFAFESFGWRRWRRIRHDLGFISDDQPHEKPSEVEILAKNQGLSNAFLAAGLVWGLCWLHQGRPEGDAVMTFFLLCIAVAGLVGFVTVRPPRFPGKVGFLVLQTGLAVLALICLRW